MAYADENASRRNLTVTSLCFIIYYLAGGEFLNSTVTLLVINIEFTKPVILAAIAWLLLFWFALRYWQIHRNKIGMTSDEDLKSTPYFVHSKLAIWYVEKKTGKKFRTKGDFVPLRVTRYGGALNIEIKDIINGQEGNDGKLTSYNTENNQSIEISNISGLILKSYLYIYLAFTKPGFGDYFVPYLLFYTAFLLGAYYSLLPCLIDFTSNITVIPAQAGIQ